jgi:hypothetical protein
MAVTLTSIGRESTVSQMIDGTADAQARLD